MMCEIIFFFGKVYFLIWLLRKLNGGINYKEYCFYVFIFYKLYLFFYFK